MKTRRIFYIILIVILSYLKVFSQETIDLRQTLTEETYKIWDEYILKHAPSDSAFRVVETIEQRHFYAHRAAVSRYVLQKYRSIFPQYDSLINSKIKGLRTNHADSNSHTGYVWNLS